MTFTVVVSVIDNVPFDWLMSYPEWSPIPRQILQFELVLVRYYSWIASSSSSHTDLINFARFSLQKVQQQQQCMLTSRGLAPDCKSLKLAAENQLSGFSGCLMNEIRELLTGINLVTSLCLITVQLSQQLSNLQSDAYVSGPRCRWRRSQCGLINSLSCQSINHFRNTSDWASHRSSQPLQSNAAYI